MTFAIYTLLVVALSWVFRSRTKWKYDCQDTARFNSFRAGAKAIPQLWLSLKQSSFYPHIRIFILTIKQLLRNFNRFFTVCLLASNNMLHSLFRFQNQISCRMIGFEFLHVNTFTYSLLKGVFQLDRTANKLAVYGRTIFSLIFGFPLANALISA